MSDSNADNVPSILVPAKAPPPVQRLGAILNERFTSLIDLAPAALSSKMDPLRIAKLALHSYQTNPNLLECSPESFFVALFDALKYGLDPTSPHGYAYLVPRKKRACFQVGYKGYLFLARKLGMVKDARANVVVQGEEFSADFIEGKLTHKWALDADHTDESRFVAAYAIAWPADGSDRAHFCVLDRKQVHARRAVAMTQTIWNTWPDRMWRKTAVLTLFRGGEVEIDPMFAELMERDTEFEIGQNKTVVATGGGVGAVKAALGITEDPVEASLPDPTPAEMPLDDAPVYGDPTDAPASAKPQPMQRTALQTRLAAEWKASGRSADEFEGFAQAVIGKPCADNDEERQRLIDALLSGGGA